MNGAEPWNQPALPGKIAPRNRFDPLCCPPSALANRNLALSRSLDKHGWVPRQRISTRLLATTPDTLRQSELEILLEKDTSEMTGMHALLSRGSLAAAAVGKKQMATENQPPVTEKNACAGGCRSADQEGPFHRFNRSERLISGPSRSTVVQRGLCSSSTRSRETRTSG